MFFLFQFFRRCIETCEASLCWCSLCWYPNFLDIQLQYIISVVNHPFHLFKTLHIFGFIFLDVRLPPKMLIRGSCSQAANVYVMLNIAELVLWKGQNRCNPLAHTVVPPTETACANLAFSQKSGPKGWIVMLLLQDTSSIVRSTIIPNHTTNLVAKICKNHSPKRWCMPFDVLKKCASYTGARCPPIVCPGLMGGCICQDRPVNKKQPEWIWMEWHWMLLRPLWKYCDIYIYIYTFHIMSLPNEAGKLWHRFVAASSGLLSLSCKECLRFSNGWRFDAMEAKPWKLESGI